MTELDLGGRVLAGFGIVAGVVAIAIGIALLIRWWPAIRARARLDPLGAVAATLLAVAGLLVLGAITTDLVGMVSR